MADLFSLQISLNSWVDLLSFQSNSRYLRVHESNNILLLFDFILFECDAPMCQHAKKPVWKFLHTLKCDIRYVHNINRTFDLKCTNDLCVTQLGNNDEYMIMTFPIFGSCNSSTDAEDLK